MLYIYSNQFSSVISLLLPHSTLSCTVHNLSVFHFDFSIIHDIYSSFVLLLHTSILRTFFNRHVSPWYLFLLQHSDLSLYQIVIYTFNSYRQCIDIMFHDYIQISIFIRLLFERVGGSSEPFSTTLNCNLF